MKKAIFALALAFAFVGTASAANLTADAIFDGQTDLYGTPNASKTVKGHFQVDAGEVLHAIRTDFLGDNLPAVCHDVTNVQGAQETDRSVSVKLPPNTGDYGFELVPYVAANMNEANAMQGSAACQGTTGTVYNNGNVVHVIPSGNNSNDDEVGGEEDSLFASLYAMIEALKKQIADLTKPAPVPPTPTKPAYCASLALYASTGKYSATTEINALQTLLVTNGFMSQSGHMTGPGIYGPRTTNAHILAKAPCA